MELEQIVLASINVVGGILVLGSYVQGIVAHPSNRDAIWGGVPERIKPFYTVSMLSAAAGYFAFTGFVLFGLDPDEAFVGGVPVYSVLYGLYALILLPSALWMPLTYTMLDQPRAAVWWAIRTTLAVVGLASLGLLGSLAALSDAEPAWAYWLAVAGAVAFSIQTAVLDALVWPAFFPVRARTVQST